MDFKPFQTLFSVCELLSDVRCWSLPGALHKGTSALLIEGRALLISLLTSPSPEFQAALRAFFTCITLLFSTCPARRLQPTPDLCLPFICLPGAFPQQPQILLFPCASQSLPLLIPRRSSLWNLFATPSSTFQPVSTPLSHGRH